MAEIDDDLVFSQGRSTETGAELERQLVTLNGHVSAATYRFLLLMHTADARSAEALDHGRISYSRVRALSRIAMAESEGFFLDVAEHGTALHKEKIARSIR